MIRGMGLYTTESVLDVSYAPDWSDPGAGHPEPMLRKLSEQCRDTPGSFVWLGLFEPTREELDSIGVAFELPHLLVEDAANTAQRPKFELDERGEGLVILKVLDYVESTSDVNTGQIAIFIGAWFAITVRYGQIGDLRGIRDRLESDAGLRGQGPVAVLYGVMDLVVDGYLAVADEVNIDVENLETAVFAVDGSQMATNSIYRLKRENVEMRRAVGPLVPHAHNFVQESLLPAWIPRGLRPYFRDIGDHVLRVADAVEATDNLLLTMLMASTSLQDLRQNRDMRKISAWVAIAAVPTALAAIYGMNFDYMPELHQPWGYPAILGVMAISCVALWRAFKRSGWL